jgi:hypothetical protein
MVCQPGIELVAFWIRSRSINYLIATSSSFYEVLIKGVGVKSESPNTSNLLLSKGISWCNLFCKLFLERKLYLSNADPLSAKLYRLSVNVQVTIDVLNFGVRFLVKMGVKVTVVVLVLRLSKFLKLSGTVQFSNRKEFIPVRKVFVFVCISSRYLHRI